MASNGLHLFSTAHKYSSFLFFHNFIHAQIILIFLLLLTNQTNSLTCPTSSTNVNEITSDTWSYSGYADTFVHGIAVGPVSNSLYFLYYVQNKK